MKISLPLKKSVSQIQKEININPGDLVLMVSNLKRFKRKAVAHRKQDELPISNEIYLIGVFQGIQKKYAYRRDNHLHMRLDTPFHLRFPFGFRGSFLPYLIPQGNSKLYAVSSRHDIFVGKEEIIACLSQKTETANYIDLVRNIE